IYIRLTSDELDVGTIWIEVMGERAYAGEVNWLPIADGHDGWIQFIPLEEYTDGDSLNVTAGAATQGGSSIILPAYTFEVSNLAPAPTVTTSITTTADVPPVDPALASPIGITY